MSRHRRRNPWSRIATTAGRVWRRVRARCHGANGAAWGIAAVGLAVIATFGLLLQTVHAAKVERKTLRCLALNVYYEARGEPEAGRYAVAEVTMNRVRSSYYPNDICDVVYQKNWDSRRKRYVAAFSWTELKSLPAPTGEEWRAAWKVAEDVYYGRTERKLAHALHYHADYVKPRWARERTRVARIGNHIFYR